MPRALQIGGNNAWHRGKANWTHKIVGRQFKISLRTRFFGIMPKPAKLASIEAGKITFKAPKIPRVRAVYLTALEPASLLMPTFSVICLSAKTSMPFFRSARRICLVLKKQARALAGELQRAFNAIICAPTAPYTKPVKSLLRPTESEIEDMMAAM